MTITKLEFFFKITILEDKLKNNVKLRETLIGGNIKESNNTNRTQNKKSKVH
jgi:hypothetical protein